MFKNVYAGRRVLVTGHTGFKGSWLTVWLLKMGAELVGVSHNVPTKPAMFEELCLEGKIKHLKADIRDLDRIREIFIEEQPDFVFHLAAQAIVSISYSNPVETISSNVVGTMNVLEALRGYKKPCVAVLITSDKCYDNIEWVWGYRENDALGGRDIYSGSKGAAELVIKSYLHSFFNDNHPVKIVVGRAGNVIGGGDWAKDRIVVDCMRAWSDGDAVEIRNPRATRPWQHVLEPLSGYLNLGQALIEKSELHGEAFNFGPCGDQNHTVVELLRDLSKNWSFKKPEDAYRITGDIPFHEAGLLKLNCDKALFHLSWEPNLEYEETISLVGEWYSSYHRGKTNMYKLTLEQISFYERTATIRGRGWAEEE